MGETLTEMQKKLNGANELHAVVRTMKVLAASSVGQYELSVKGLAEYYRTVELGLHVSFKKLEPNSTFTKKNEIKTKGAIIFGSDQGLVGQFNEVISDFAIKGLATLPGNHQIMGVGARLQSRLQDADLSINKIFPVPTSVQAITPLVGEMLIECEKYLSEYGPSELYLFYNKTEAESDSTYSAVAQRLLPLDEKWRNQISKLSWPSVNLPEVIGDNASTLSALIREYIFISLFRACAESLASENLARLAAMTRADKNISELLEKLNHTYHRLRQDSIDEELFDVLSGYESLSDV